MIAPLRRSAMVSDFPSRRLGLDCSGSGTPAQQRASLLSMDEERQPSAPHCTICEIAPAASFDTICPGCRAVQQRGERRMIGWAIALFAGAPLLVGLIYGAKF